MEKKKKNQLTIVQNYNILILRLWKKEVINMKVQYWWSYIEKLDNKLKSVRYWLWSIDNISLSM